MSRATTLQRAIDALMAKLGSGPEGDGQPHGFGLSDQTGRIAVEIADLRLEWEHVIGDAWTRAKEIQETILAVNDPIYVPLLFGRYIELKSWGEITDDLRMDNEQYVRGKLHALALAAVEKIREEREDEDKRDHSILE